MIKIIVPYEGAENVTLFGEHYDVEDGEIEVSEAVAEQVLNHPDLSMGGGAKWVIRVEADPLDDLEPIDDEEPEIVESHRALEVVEEGVGVNVGTTRKSRKR